MDLQFQVYGKIARPVAEVFDAVHDPAKLSSYFTTGGASAPLDEGTTVMWDFHDYPGAFPVHVRKVEPNSLMELQWRAADGEYDTSVRIDFEAIDDSATMVRISESGWRDTPEGLRSSYGNCMGWTQMLCCMKVYLEHGVKLREFFF